MFSRKDIKIFNSWQKKHDGYFEDYVWRTDGVEKRTPVPVEKISQGLASNLALQAGDIVFIADRLL